VTAMPRSLGSKKKKKVSNTSNTGPIPCQQQCRKLIYLKCNPVNKNLFLKFMINRYLIENNFCPFFNQLVYFTEVLLLNAHNLSKKVQQIEL